MTITTNQNEMLFRYKVRAMLQLKREFRKGKIINDIDSLLIAFLDVFFEKVVVPDQIVNVNSTTYTFKNVKDAAYFFTFLMGDLTHDTSMALVKGWSGRKDSKRGVDIVIGFVWNLYSIHPYAMAAIIDFMMTDDQFENDVNFLFANKSTGGVGEASGLEGRMLELAKKYTPGKNYYRKIKVDDSTGGYTMVFDQSSKGTVTTVGQTKTKRIVLGVPVDADKGLTQADNVSSSLVEVLYRFIRSHSYAWLRSNGAEDLAGKMVAAGLANTTGNNNRSRNSSFQMFRKFTFNTATSWTANIKLEIPKHGAVDIFTNKYTMDKPTDINKIRASIQMFDYYPPKNKQAWARLMENTSTLKKAGAARTRAGGANVLAKMNVTNMGLISTFPPGFPLSAKQARGQGTLQEAMLKTITDLNLMFYAHSLTDRSVDTVRYATGDRAAAAVCMLLHTIDRTPDVINRRGGQGFPYIFESNRIEIFVSSYEPVARRNNGIVRNRPNTSNLSSRFTVKLPGPTQTPLLRRRQANVAMAEGNVNRYAAELNAVLSKIRSVVPRNRMTNSTYIQLLGQYEQLRNNTAKRDLIMKYINPLNTSAKQRKRS